MERKGNLRATEMREQRKLLRKERERRKEAEPFWAKKSHLNDWGPAFHALFRALIVGHQMWYRLDVDSQVYPHDSQKSQIYQLSRQQERLTMAEIERVIRAPKSTLKFHLKKLVSDGYLARHGHGRAIWYAGAAIT